MTRARVLRLSRGRSRPDARSGRARARLSPLPAFALLAGALVLFPAAPAQAQYAPNVSVAPGDGKLTATYDIAGLPGSQVNTVGMRWRVKDTNPSRLGIQPGSWLPSNAGHSFSRGAQESTSSVPPSGCSSCGALTNGTEYEVSVRLHWGGRWYDWSTNVSGTPGVPVAISDLSAAEGGGKLDLSWTAPASTVSPIIGYDVHYTSASAEEVDDDADAGGNDASAAWVDAGHSGTTASHTIPRLAGGTTYRVRVRAANRHGGAAWAHTTGTPAVAGPTGLTVTPGGSLLDVSWNAVPGAILYEVQYTSAPKTGSGAVADDADPTSDDPAASWVVWVLDPGTSIRITGLTNGKPYRVRVRWSSVTTQSVWAFGSGTPEAPPPATDPPGVPVGLSVWPVFTRQLELEWRAPSGTVSGYDVHYTSSTSVLDDADASGDDASAAWVAASRSGLGVAPNHLLTELTNDTPYRVRVRGVNAAGAGNWAFGTGTPMGPSTVWSAKLVVQTGGSGALGTFIGCHNTSACNSALSDNTIDVGATMFSLSAIKFYPSGTHAGRLQVEFNPVGTAALRALKFCVGSSSFALSGVTGNAAIWANANLGWSVGDTVSLSIGSSCGPDTRSTDATLSALVLKYFSTVVPFDQTFSWTTYAYTANVVAERDFVTVTPTVTESNATVKVNGTTVTSTQASDRIDLDIGANRITVEVTAQARNTRNYTITVNRALPEVKWPGPGQSVAEGSPSNPRVEPTASNDMSGTLSYAASGTHPASLTDDVGSGRPTMFTMTAGDTYLSTIRIPTVDDALNEEDETFTVTFEEGTGYTVGSPSVFTVTITDNDPPAAPGSFKVSAGNTELAASWSKPAGPVAGYQLRWKTAAATDQAATTPGNPSTGWVEGGAISASSLSQKITSLTNDTTYHVQVRADDGQTAAGNGYGDWSPSQSQTPQTKTYSFSPTSYTGVLPGSRHRATVALSEAAPTGGLALTVTALFGTALPTNLCTGTLADSDDIGPNPPTTVTVQEGQTEARFRYPIADNGDDLVGGSECFALRLGTSASGWTAGTGAVGKFTIERNRGLVAMGESGGWTTKYEATVAETVSGGVLSVPVTVDHLPSANVEFTVEVLTGGTATEWVSASDPGDFRIEDKAVAFGPMTSKRQVVNVTITNDAEVEANETIELRIAPAGSGAAAVNRAYTRHAQGSLATVTITSEDAVPDAVTGLVVSSDSARLDLTWNAPVNAGSSAITGYDVHYTSANAQTVANNAAAGTNAATSWVAVSRSGTAASDSIKGLTNDTDYRVRVRAANASGPGAWAFGAGTPATTPSVWLGVSPNPVAEGSSVTVTATLSKALSADVTIPLTLTDGTSDPGDFRALGPITITAGQLSGTNTITTSQDTDADDETFTVALGSPLPSEVVAGSPSEIEVTITDDEKPSVSLDASPNPVTEGEAVTITATLTAALSDDVTIPVTLADGSAESGDYAKTLTGITVAAGRTTGTGTIQTNHDAGEDDETFTVALGSPLPAAVLSTSRSSVMVTISDDEGIPSVTLGASPNPVDEGGDVTVTVTLSKALAGDVTIPLTLTDGSAESGDYGTLTGITVTGGQTTGEGRIRTNQDTDADDETFTVALGTLPSTVRAGAATSVEVRIADDDKATATLEVSPNPVDEGERVTVTARLDKALPDAVILPLTLSNGSAEDGDYGTLTSLRIPAGYRNATGVITTVRDEDEEDETFTVALGSPLPSSVLAGDPSSVEVRIRDDGPLRAELSSSTLRPAEGRSARLTATLNHPAPAGGVRVRFFADGSGDNPAYPVSDFTLAPASEGQNVTEWIGIDEGKRSATGWLRVVDDDVPEDDERLVVWVDGDWTAESPELELTIPANDGGGSGPAAWIDAEPNPVPEGRDVEVRVWLTKALDADARIPLTVRRVSSEAGDHGTLQEVVIAAGELVGRGTISTMRDDDIDDEKFEVRLGRLPSGVRAGTASSVEIVIYDLDEPPRRAWLEVSPNPVDEGDPVTVTARLTEGLPGSVTIPIEVEHVTSEQDDHGTLRSIRIAAGATSGTGRITTARDEDGDNETFIVRLGEDMPSGVEAGSPDSVEVVIVDEHGTPAAAVSLAAAPNPVGEGESVTVTATLDKALARSVTIPLAVERGSSESGDHGSLSGIRIASGATEGTGTITTRVDDDIDDETFTVKLRANLPEGVLAGRPDSVEVVIVDEGAPTPAAVSLEAAPNPVPEGESVTVTATLDKALSSSVRIPLTVERGSSESGDHGSLSSIRIASGDTEGTGTITTSVDDDIDDETFTVKLRPNLPAEVMAGSPSEIEVTIADRGGDAPGRVRSLRVTAGDGRLDLTWTAPSSGTVTAYEAWYKERSASGWTVVHEDNYQNTEAEITNLDNGTAYDVRVRASNDYGVGPWATGSGTPTGPSSANDLTSLSVRASKTDDGTYSSVSLSPSFRASTTAYRVTAPAGTRYAKFRPRAASSSALILVDGHEVASGAESPAVAVSQGKVIWIAVIPADNSEAKEYSVTFSIPQASMDAARSVNAAADAALAVIGELSPEDAAGALLGERSLAGERLEALDRLGNANGRYDLGDLLSWIERCRTGGARCGEPPRTPPPSQDAALPAAAGAIGAGTVPRRPRRRGSGGRNPKRRRTGMFAVLLAAALWSCDGAGVVDLPAAADVPDPGYLAVEWTAPAGGPAAVGALVEIDGPGIGDARALGLELYESEGNGPKRFVIAGGMRDGTVLEFRVPDRRQAGLYSVRVVEVAGKDHRLLAADAYRTAIAND